MLCSRDKAAKVSAPGKPSGFSPSQNKILRPGTAIKRPHSRASRNEVRELESMDPLVEGLLGWLSCGPSVASIG